MGLIGEDPGYADAYDVLGRAQVEMGHFAEAIETYRTASELTPDSVVRLQKLGMMCYYMGERATAVQVLSRAVVLGIDSKLFDYQSLVLLAFAHFDEKDGKGIDRCIADFGRVLDRHGNSQRIQRFAQVVGTLQAIHQNQVARAVQLVRSMAPEIRHSAFDLEAACNLGSLLSVLANTSIDLQEGHEWIEAIGMRYSSTRGLCELLASACRSCEAYAEKIRDCLQRVNRMAEEAMAQHLAGAPAQAIDSLLQSTRKHLNTKLIDLAQQLLLRHQTHLPDAPALQEQIDDLRTQCGSAPARALLGQDSERQPGGVALRATANASAA